MSAPFHLVKRKTEDAWENVINALKGTNLAGLTIVKAFDTVTLKDARIEIMVPVAEPEKIGDIITGNYFVQVFLTLISIKEDQTRTVHGLRAGELGDIIMRDDVEAQLNTAGGGVTDYHAFPPSWTPGTITDTVENDIELHTEFTGEVKCAPSDF